MTNVGCGLVGYGMIGREHARILTAMPMANLLAVCDTNPKVEEEIPTGPVFSTDLEQMLGTPGLEAVWVCTPQHLHRAIVERALKQGLHVLCEKPLAASLGDADAMIECSRQHGDRLVVGHTLRFDPDYIAVRDAVVAGRLGDIVQMAARWNAPQHEGRIISGRTTVALEMMIHDLDAMRWLAGNIESVFGLSVKAGIVGPGPDASVAVISFDSGAVASLDHNWIMADETAVRSDHRLAVFGSKGSAYIEARETPAAIFAPDQTQYVRSNYYSYPNGMPTGALASEDFFFLARVRDSRPWPLTLNDAREAVRAALAIDKSVAEGRPIQIANMH